MAKAFMCVKDVQLDEDGTPRLIYHVIVPAEGGKAKLDYGCDFPINPALSMDEVTEALKTKVLNDAVSRGYRMSKGDVIPHGLPMAKDTVSYTDKTSGITSDKTATVQEPVVSKELEQPTLVARAVDTFSRAFDWMMG